MRRALAGLAVVLVLLVGGVALGAGAILNTPAVTERVVDALARASGHGVVLGGPIRLTWSTIPKLAIGDVMFLNGPGYSRKALATVQRVVVRVALWPLLRGRIEVRSVLVEQPDVLLERDAQGVGNWMPARGPDGGGQVATGDTGPRRPARPMNVDVLRIERGRVAYAGVAPVEVRSMTVSPGGGPLAAALVVDGVALSAGGTTQAPSAGTVPFVLNVSGAGMTASATGALGGVVTFKAAAADLAMLAPLAGRRLPAIADVVLTGQAGDGAMSLTVETGGAGPAALSPGWTLVRSATVMSGLQQPVRTLAQLAYRGLPVAAAVTFGPGRARGPVPVQVTLTADGGTLTAAGDLDVTARTLSGTVSARIPDLRRAGALMGLGLPSLHDLAVDVRVQASGPATLLRGLRIISAEGDWGGDLAFGLSPRPSLRGSLQSQRVDMDAWTPVAAAATPPMPMPMPMPMPPGPGGATPEPAARAPAAAPPGDWLIPDTPLPFASLLRMDLDVQWNAAALTLHQAVYRALHMRVLLQDGRLRVDPAGVAAPGGLLTGLLEADVRAQPPTLALVLKGRGLDLGAETGGSAAGGTRGAVTGTLDVDIGLEARGETPHALAGTLSGHVLATLTNGDVENAALLALAGPALRAAGTGFDPAGRSALRCFAIRTDIAAGQATVPTLALDASRVRLEADGRVDLGQETLDVHARPEVKLGPVPVRVPVHVTGPWRSPRTEVDKGVVAPGRFGISIGGGAGNDRCGPALAVVRQGMGAIQ